VGSEGRITKKRSGDVLPDGRTALKFDEGSL
jgi:hypothetical protein